MYFENSDFIRLYLYFCCGVFESVGVIPDCRFVVILVLRKKSQGNG